MYPLKNEKVPPNRDKQVLKLYQEDNIRLKLYYVGISDTLPRDAA